MAHIGRTSLTIHKSSSSNAVSNFQVDASKPSASTNSLEKVRIGSVIRATPRRMSNAMSNMRKSISGGPFDKSGPIAQRSSALSAGAAAVRQALSPEFQRVFQLTGETGSHT